jgi:hypothetical protein
MVRMVMLEVVLEVVTELAWRVRVVVRRRRRRGLMRLVLV